MCTISKKNSNRLQGVCRVSKTIWRVSYLISIVHGKLLEYSNSKGHYTFHSRSLSFFCNNHKKQYWSYIYWEDVYLLVVIDSLWWQKLPKWCQLRNIVVTIISIRMGIQILEGTRKLHSLRISIILSRSKIEKKAKISEKSELQLVLLLVKMMTATHPLLSDPTNPKSSNKCVMKV